MLKYKDDIDALCPTDMSPKEILLPYHDISDKFWK